MSGKEAHMQNNAGLSEADQRPVFDDLAFTQRYVPPKTDLNLGLCWKLPSNKQILHDLKILGFNMDTLLKAICPDEDRKVLLAQIVDQLYSVPADRSAFDTALETGMKVQALEVEMAVFRKAAGADNAVIQKFLLEKLMPERYGKSVKERVGDEKANELKRFREALFQK